jgi:hypothetical protein
MTFHGWELAARIALTDMGVDPADIDTLMTEARAHHQDSGGSPTDVLGSPRDFAAAMAAERQIPSRADAVGHTAVEWIQGSLFVLGLAGVACLLFGALSRQDLSVPVTVSGLAGAVLLGVAWVTLLCAVPAVRAAGRPQLSPALLVAGITAAAGSVAVLTLGPSRPLAVLPLPLLLAAGLGWIWLSANPPPRRNSEISTPTPRDSLRPSQIGAVPGGAATGRS